jgi:hypothetical protein
MYEALVPVPEVKPIGAFSQRGRAPSNSTADRSLYLFKDSNIDLDPLRRSRLIRGTSGMCLVDAYICIRLTPRVS